MTIYNKLTSVLCDPDGKVCISGSDEDRRIVQEALDVLEALESVDKDALDRAIKDHFISTASEGAFDYEYDKIVSEAAKTLREMMGE